MGLDPTPEQLREPIQPRAGRHPGPPRLAALISGGGRTIANLLDAIEHGELEAEIPIVVASRPCHGVDRLRARGLTVRVRPGDLTAEKLGAHLAEFDADWVVLGGYLRLLPIPPGYRGRVVNIHPAPLPDFGGAGMFGERVHRAVLESGRSTSGCTVHLCDERYDHGPVVLERCCQVEPGDTPASLAARVFELEREAYPAALRLLFEVDATHKPVSPGERTEP